jgi:hypothetical protein
MIIAIYLTLHGAFFVGHSEGKECREDAVAHEAQVWVTAEPKQQALPVLHRHPAGH